MIDEYKARLWNLSKFQNFVAICDARNSTETYQAKSVSNN